MVVSFLVIVTAEIEEMPGLTKGWLACHSWSTFFTERVSNWAIAATSRQAW
jgi:hypothetical protein